jgi:hypothetical protein
MLEPGHALLVRAGIRWFIQEFEILRQTRLYIPGFQQQPIGIFLQQEWRKLLGNALPEKRLERLLSRYSVVWGHIPAYRMTPALGIPELHCPPAFRGIVHPV